MPKMCKNCLEKAIELSNDEVNCTHSKLAILFSGGLDSAILASLAHGFLPLGEPIDLLNVAFESNSKAGENNSE